MKIQIDHSEIKKTYQASIRFPEGFSFSLPESPLKDRVDYMIQSLLQHSLLSHKTINEHWEFVKHDIEILAKVHNQNLASIGFNRNDFKREFNHLFAVIEQTNS